MRVLRILAFPISLIYAVVVYVRNLLFDIDFFKSKKFNTPTICVGNLSVGGTGKTPMIEFLLSTLKAEHKLAVLSRGYGRKSKGYQISTEAATVEILGDEPYQIAQKFPEVPVVVDADRQHGIATLETSIAPDVILLDDAFQHRKVTPSFSMLLTAYDNRYQKDWYLPTGSLRDSKKEAKRANLIVVTKCPMDLSNVEQEKIVKEIGPEAGQEVFFSFLHYKNELKGGSENLEIIDLVNRKVTLVTGIANPQPLLSFLESNGIVVEHLNFRDHHFFSETEIENFNSKEFILTTEKDYVRLKGKVFNLHYIGIEHQFLNEGALRIKEALSALLN
ncbi:tetraacyldisaccharide 4'-kinase [Cellulophaga sp. HaHa_2_95]|uniref:tetraacyldisaccharide 4'-kinase n=1 Tax=Cellulophaga sp. HaHa_2_95 TaxID=2745558 RepID=UPI001C4E5004|nr:tetraacyldisaccharide 4'-kinase [Cellulophaga sp. HaHa_2_95]QXP58165.1 tetraacyldisaccharide 4'-kinase [Cellulophaga sp. HaHa_2_95]